MRILSYLLPVILFFSCQEEKEKENQVPTEKSTEETTKDTLKTEKKEAVTLNTDPAFLEWKTKIAQATFESKLFEDKATAITWFEENGYTVTDNYSPEESKSILWVVVESSDGKYAAELNYDYYDEDGGFQGFRNIVTKIGKDDRDEIIQLFTQMADEATRLTPQKYKKSYGEEGLVWYEENTGQTLQTVVVTKGGNTDWIEIVRCNYFRISKEEIVK